MSQSKRPTRNRRQRGFTLVELMYAFGYFMLGIAGLTFFHVVANNATQHAADISMATMLTSNAIETVRNDPNQQQTALMPTTTQVLYDRYGNAQTSSSYAGVPYFTVTTNNSMPAGASVYFQTVVQTTWYQLPVTSFQHGVIMQTFIPTGAGY